MMLIRFSLVQWSSLSGFKHSRTMFKEKFPLYIVDIFFGVECGSLGLAARFMEYREVKGVSLVFLVLVNSCVVVA